MKKEVASKLRIGGLPGLKTDTATAHTSSAGRGRVLSFTRRDGNVDFPQKITIKKKKTIRAPVMQLVLGSVLAFRLYLPGFWWHEKKTAEEPYIINK